LSYADFLSHHYTAHGHISCNCGTKSNYCRLPSYIHSKATYLLFHPTLYLSYYNRPVPSFFLYSSSNLLLPTMVSIVQSSGVEFPCSMPSRSSHLHTVIPAAILPSNPLLSQIAEDLIKILDVVLPHVKSLAISFYCSCIVQIVDKTTNLHCRATTRPQLPQRIAW